MDVAVQAEEPGKLFSDQQDRRNMNASKLTTKIIGYGC